MKQSIKALVPERIFTSLGNCYEYGKAVLIDGKEIVDIISVSDIHKSIQRYDYKDCTLLPGLIDTHCHLEDWVAPMCLSYGITTIRDTGNDLNWILAKREEMEEPEALGPSVLCCGPVLDGKKYLHPDISWGIEKDQDMLLAIEYLQSCNVDAVKLYVGLDLNKIKIAVEECRKRGLHLLGHFQGSIKLFDAVKAGVPEVEHFYEIPSFYSEEIIQEIIKRGTWIVPTQMVWEGPLAYQSGRQEVLDYMDFIPEGKIKKYLRDFWKNINKNDPNLEKLKEFCKNNRKYIKEMIKQGGKIAPGTDAPAQLSFPGLSFFDELKVYFECGMSGSDVLKCATVNAAELLGIKGSTGTIEKGKDADIIIVEGDPLKNLPDLRSIKCVYKKGYMHLPHEVLQKTNPASMATNHLPDIMEAAVEWEDWKQKYLK